MRPSARFLRSGGVAWQWPTMAAAAPFIGLQLSLSLLAYFLLFWVIVLIVLLSCFSSLRAWLWALSSYVLLVVGCAAAARLGLEALLVAPLTERGSSGRAVLFPRWYAVLDFALSFTGMVVGLPLAALRVLASGCLLFFSLARLDLPLLERAGLAAPHPAVASCCLCLCACGRGGGRGTGRGAGSGSSGSGSSSGGLWGDAAERSSRASQQLRRLDPGIAAYDALLAADTAHNHPMLIASAYIMSESILEARAQRAKQDKLPVLALSALAAPNEAISGAASAAAAAEAGVGGGGGAQGGGDSIVAVIHRLELERAAVAAARLVRSRARTRWHLALLLARNPGLARWRVREAEGISIGGPSEQQLLRAPMSPASAAQRRQQRRASLSQLGSSSSLGSRSAAPQEGSYGAWLQDMQLVESRAAFERSVAEAGGRVRQLQRNAEAQQRSAAQTRATV
jgi:hypothetical protein